MEQKLENYSNGIKELTFFVSRSIISQIHSKDEYLKEPKRFFYTLLFKINNGLDSVNILIRNVNEIPSVSDSICLLLRTLASDLIHLDYILLKSKNDPVQLKNWIENIYHDHVKYILRSLEIYAVFDNWSEAELTEKQVLEKKRAPNYYNADGTLKEGIMEIPPMNKLCKTILAQRDKNDIIIDFRKLYEFYDFFSKYEHLGHLTFPLIHRAFDSKHKPAVLSEIECAISTILNYQFWLITNFFEPDGPECSEYLKLIHSIKLIKLTE